MKDSADPRIARTKNRLHSALIAILDTKRLEDITIAEIIATSGVSNATFFRHYADKMALFQAVFERMIFEVNDLITPALASGNHLQGAMRICEHVASHPQVYRFLLGGGAADQMRAVLLENALEIEEIDRQSRTTALGIPSRLVSNFMVSALLAIIGWWLDEQESVSMEDAASLMHDLVFRPIVEVSDKGVYPSLAAPELLHRARS